MNKIKYSLSILLFLLLISCNNSDNPSIKSSEELDANINANSTELKIGGLYVSKNENGMYSVSKILATDDFAVHLRLYKDEFETKPVQLNSASLSVMIGHAPLDKDGFLKDKPELITIEKINDAELEGYKIYLEAMSK
jgi:hypothetical protein